MSTRKRLVELYQLFICEKQNTKGSRIYIGKNVGLDAVFMIKASGHLLECVWMGHASLLQNVRITGVR